MRTYTLEVATFPVIDDDWAAHTRVLDTIPGSALLEDQEDPILIFDVDAESLNKAMAFVSGIAQQFDFIVKSVTVIDESEASKTGMAPDLEAVEEWVGKAPAPDRRKPISC